MLFSANPGNLPPLSLHPGLESELKRRALYFCTALGINSARIIRQALSGWAVKYGASTANREWSSTELSQAVKELLCVELVLVLEDYGGERAPPWLTQFILLTLAYVDEFYPGLKSTEIADACKKEVDSRVLSTHVIMRIVDRLSLDTGSAMVVAAALESTFGEERDVKAEVLGFALTQPLDLLDEQINLHKLMI